MKQSTDGGLRHGGNVAPRKKFLRKLMSLTSVRDCGHYDHLVRNIGCGR